MTWETHTLKDDEGDDITVNAYDALRETLYGHYHEWVTPTGYEWETFRDRYAVDPHDYTDYDEYFAAAHRAAVNCSRDWQTRAPTV